MRKRDKAPTPNYKKGATNQTKRSKDDMGPKKPLGSNRQKGHKSLFG